MKHLPLLIAGAMALGVALPGSDARTAPGAAAFARAVPAAETIRLKSHFSAVLQELEARDVTHLTAQQRGAREAHTEVLRAYAQGGVFPRNHVFPGRRVPVFVDEHGTLCAMAHLIARSGHTELVERVAQSRNNAFIPELADDPELVAWVESAGLTLEEAARIQPSYNWEPPTAPARKGITLAWGGASAAASALGVTTSLFSLGTSDSPGASRWPGALGVAAGTAGIALGVDRIGSGGATTAAAAVIAGVGLTSVAIGSWRLLGFPGDAGNADAPPRASIRVTPLVEYGERAGLRLSARW
jgi:hypothetical protein